MKCYLLRSELDRVHSAGPLYRPERRIKLRPPRFTTEVMVVAICALAALVLAGLAIARNLGRLP